MMELRVGIISNLHEQCGNAAYGRDLCSELLKHFLHVDIGHEDQLTWPLDVVIFNWHPARVDLSLEKVQAAQARGAKVIVILQNSFEGPVSIGPGNALAQADAVVAHEPMDSDYPIHVIPHGIVEVDNLPEVSNDLCFGTAGFPFDWKRFDVVAEAAKRYSARCLMIAPQSDQYNTDSFMDGIAGHLGGLADVRRQWMSVSEVVRNLATCTLNIFWYESKCTDDQLGQSGSVRMGIAALRPTIISTHRKLRTLQKYTRDLYICEKEEDVYKAVDEILLDSVINAKRPYRVMQEQGWSVSGAMYERLIREVFNGGA